MTCSSLLSAVLIYVLASGNFVPSPAGRRPHERITRYNSSLAGGEDLAEGLQATLVGKDIYVIGGFEMSIQERDRVRRYKKKYYDDVHILHTDRTPMVPCFFSCG